MPRLLHKSRPLYLLALFQLVGGPVVLLAVLLFGRLSVTNVAERGLVAGIAATAQSEKWQSAAQELVQGVTGLPATQDHKVPVPTKESKGALYTTDTQKPVSAPASPLVGMTPWQPGDRFAAARPHAPPIPPPRWA